MSDRRELAEIKTESRFLLVKNARLKDDTVRNCQVLLLPELVIKLNNTSAGILSLCDGSCTFDEMLTLLEEQFQADNIEADVREFLKEAARRGWIEIVS